MFASSDYDSSESSYDQDQGGQNYRQDDVVQETCMSASEGMKEIPTVVRQDGVDEHAGGIEYTSVGVIERENKDGENQREVGVIEYASVGVKDRNYGESTKSNKTELKIRRHNPASNLDLSIAVVFSFTTYPNRYKAATGGEGLAAIGGERLAAAAVVVISFTASPCA
ncbi:hypothetical protein L2E82_28775 [Cichorium intybus]|uniref:Uncharacterized protein n=1 Tax=Cichorium intybus TaxID=13427 RepID=A0ACB9CWH9_CICIN|nr:hypothetical protein L2E82_28775 [Cichorium intybus]